MTTEETAPARPSAPAATEDVPAELAAPRPPDRRPVWGAAAAAVAVLGLAGALTLGSGDDPTPSARATAEATPGEPRVAAAGPAAPAPAPAADPAPAPTLPDDRPPTPEPERPPVPGLARVEALVGRGERREALRALEELSPRLRATAEARMLAAELLLEEDRHEDAVAELEPAVDGAPAPLLALYARALLAAGRVGEAGDAYLASLEVDPDLPEGLYGRAEMAVRSQRGDDALNLVRRLERSLEVRRRPLAFHVRAQYMRGRAHLVAGESEDAIATLARVIESDLAPNDAFFYYAEAQVGHNHAEARDAYRRYLAHEPEGFYAARARRALGLEPRPVAGAETRPRPEPPAPAEPEAEPAPEPAPDAPTAG